MKDAIFLSSSMTRTLIICWHGPRKDGQGQSGIRRSSAVFLGLLERGVIGQGTIAWTRLCVYPRSSCKLTHRRPLGPVAAVCAVCVRLLARGGWAPRDLSSSLDFLTHRQRDGRWVFAFGAKGMSFKGERKSERRIANVRVQASGSLGNHRMGGAEPECPEYPARGRGGGTAWIGA